MTGVIGLGHMGSAFASRLLSHGFHVLAYDRERARVQELEKAGAEAASDLRALASCEVVLTSLPDDEALEDLAFNRLMPALAPGAIHLGMSTISPQLSKSLAAAHERHGQGYVAAPVLGNPDLARTGKVFVLAAGSARAMRTVQPVLEALGERVFIVDTAPDRANLMKLAGNVLTAITLQGMAEVLALLRKAGIDQQLGFDILTNSLFDSKVHRAYGGKIVAERYRPAGMVVPLAVKDLRLALAEAERAAVPMPTASVVKERLVGLIAGGWKDLDWSALGLLEARDAGLLAS